MAVRSLAVDWERVRSETARYETLARGCRSLSPANMKLVAEMLMVRVFFLLEETIKSVASKVACGAPYLDSSIPGIAIRSRSAQEAIANMLRYNRVKALRQLKWTQESSIRQSLQHVLSPSDPFLPTIAAFAGQLEEMRVIRNHIAHGNDDTRAKFRPVVVRYYGGVRRGMSPGTLLMTKRLGPVTKLEQYLVGARVFTKALVRA